MKIPRLFNILMVVALILATFTAVKTPASAKTRAVPDSPGAEQLPMTTDIFQVLSLTANNSAVIDHDDITGDDHGGIATSNTRIFYTGDNTTGSFSLDDLSGGIDIGAQYVTMVSDLKTGKVYLLGNYGSEIPTYSGNQTVSQLLEVDGDTGALTGDAITLEPPITINTNYGGLFAGYGRVVIYDEDNGAMWSIATPSGVVSALSFPGILDAYGCETWAFWGIAEYFGGEDYVVYRGPFDDHDIMRTCLSDGTTTVLADFVNLSDMCSISANLARGRWYFHYEGSGQFGGLSETLGYADATFMTVSGFLDGHVYDADSLDPIEGAKVSAEGSETWTGPDGYYTQTLSVGTYTVMATQPKYMTMVVPSVEIIADQVTTQNFYMTRRGRLSGTVTDFDNSFPLKATLVADDGTTTTTNPFTGAYEMYLDEGTHLVTASVRNYTGESASVVMISGQDTQQDFMLKADVSIIPSPVHATLPWQSTDQLEVTLLNRKDVPYNFEFLEQPGGFAPLKAPGDFIPLASSPLPLTCVASDPDTGYLYAQQNEGTAFYRYDPWDDSWTRLADCPINSENNGGAQVLNGKVYTVYTGNDTLIGVYDIEANTWSTMLNGLENGTGNIATDGEYLYLVFGYNFVSYDPLTNQWTDLAAPSIEFQEWGGLDYIDGMLYGHEGNGDRPFARYDIAADSWTTLPDLPGGAVIGSAIDPKAKVYYAYGDYGGNQWYAFDMATETWSQSVNPLFYVNDGGLAYVGQAGISGIYLVEGQGGRGFGRFETLPYSGNILWLDEDPQGGAVPADATFDANLLFDATFSAGVNQPGDYYGTLVVVDDPQVQTPVTMTVLPAEDMGKVTGTILDTCTGKPVRTVIEIAGGDPITQTMSDRRSGEYTAWLVEGSYDLTFSAKGYVMQVETVQVEAGGTTVLDVSLTPDRPCVALEPDLLEVWVLKDTQVYTHSTDLELSNVGAQELQFELREMPGGAGPSMVTQATNNNNNMLPPGGSASNGTMATIQSSNLSSQCKVAVISGGGPETSGLHATLSELGYSWLDVNSMQEAYDAGANVFIARYEGGTNPGAGEVADWLNSGRGYIELGNTPNWFPDTYESVAGLTPLSISVADGSHPLVQGLPTAWTGLGFYVYGWSQNGLGYVDDIDYPNIIQAQYDTLRQRAVTVEEYGTGRAVYLGFNVYGNLAGVADKRLLDNAILWSGNCGVEDVPWVWEAPISGTVPVGEASQVNILFTSIVNDPLPVGTYTATLQVVTNDPVDSREYVPVVMHVVSEYYAPEASFEVSTPVCLDKQVVFTNTTTVGLPPETIYEWDFGDGTTSNEESPVHQYAATGTYQVSLTACALGGPCDTFTTTVEILPLAEAAFSYEVYGPNVTFTNLSTDALGYAWDFGDGITSTEISPMHSYGEPITYTVTLLAMNDCGFDAFTAEVKAEEFITPTASFESNAPVYLGEEVVFTNTTTAGVPPETTYVWDFGDGYMTTKENPTHTYAKVGVYEVTLIACNPENMCNTFTASVEVLVKGFWIYLPTQYKATLP
jgi:PKD repeat protein